MNFKEYIQHDINSTFVNLDEFASTVQINGVSVNVVEDEDQLQNRIKKNYDGLVVGDILFFISKEEYSKIPHVSLYPTANDAVNYNGRACLIIETNEQDGMYEIILQKAGGY